jgi:hypothetical protein
MGSLERDNHEPSSARRRCNDYPEREYAQVSGSAQPLKRVKI